MSQTQASVRVARKQLSLKTYGTLYDYGPGRDANVPVPRVGHLPGTSRCLDRQRCAARTHS